MSKTEIQQLALRLTAIEERLERLEQRPGLKTIEVHLKSIDAQQALLREAIKELGLQVGQLLARHLAV